jgi:hypothetical protein
LTGVNEEIDTSPELIKAWKASNNGEQYGLIQIPPRKAANGKVSHPSGARP